MKLSVGKIAIIVSGIGTAYALYKYSEIKNRSEEAWIRSCEATAKERRSDEDNDILKEFEKADAAAKKIWDAEQAKRIKLMDEWKKSASFSENIKAIDNEFDSNVLNWKKEHLYDETLEGLKKTRDDAINDYISSSGYDGKIAALKRDIEVAKKKYESEKTIARAVGNLDENFSDGSKALKKAAKTSMEASIKASQEKIDALTKEKNDFVSKINEQFVKDSSKIQGEYNSYVAAAKNTRDIGLKALEDERIEASKRISDEVKSARTESEQATIDYRSGFYAKVDEANKRLREATEKLKKEGTPEMKFACAAIELGFDWKDMAIIFAMPVAFGFCVLYKYGCYAYDVVYNMKNSFHVTEG